MASNEWTESGFRVLSELAGGMIILTCQSQAVTKGEGATFVRAPWLLCQLGIPAATPRSEAERIVKHWLALYNDAALSERGLTVFREAFGSLKELVPVEGKSVAPGNTSN